MRLTCVLISSAIFLLISSDVASAAESTNDENFHRTASASNRTVAHNYIRSLKTFEMNDINASEERMFDDVLRAVRVVDLPNLENLEHVENLELHQEWIAQGLTPAKLRVEVLKKEPFEPISKILQSEHSEQYLKFLVEYARRQPGSTIPKPASDMEKNELWLYAGLEPHQVRNDILKIQPGESVWKHEDVNQYLLYFVNYKRRQSDSLITKEASKMQMSELWIHAGLTPTQVSEDILKITPGRALTPHDLKYYYQFKDFLAEYNRLHGI